MKRQVYYSRKSKELSVQGVPGFLIIGDEAVKNIRANLQLEIRRRLKGFHEDIVETVMNLNERVYTIDRDDARQYSALSGKGSPVRVIYTNLFTAGRKGDSPAVRHLCRMYLRSFERLKDKVKLGKITLVKDSLELARGHFSENLMVERDFGRMADLAGRIKYVQLHPKDFCRAVSLAFSVDFDERVHLTPRHKLQ